MSLKTLQTRILTQATDVVTGTLTGFIVASFRVWQWSTGPSTPMELSSTPLAVNNRDAIAVKTTALCFVVDGGINNFLYAVNTSNQLAPVVLSHVDLSA